MANDLITVNDMMRMAESVAKSGLFGMKKPEEAMALMLIAQAEGSHPAIAVRDYHIIQGKPALKADAMQARFQAAGGKIDWKVMTDAKVSAVFSHPSGGSIEIDWDMDRAKAAGLGGKDMWKKFPRQMLRARVISEGIRTVFPGVIVGSYTPEEVQEFDSKATVIDAVATEVPQHKQQEVSRGSFSMQGEPDPNNPFKSSEERKNWILSAKADLDVIADRDSLADWLEKYGPNLKWLGNMQQRSMNEELEKARIRVGNREMDQTAAQHAS